MFENLFEACQEDHVGLWRIVNAVRFDLGVVNPDEKRALTLRLVRMLLDEPGMQVGHPAPDGRHFLSWNMPAEQAVGRIEKEWSALTREPSIGDVAWFTTSDETGGNDEPRYHR